MVFRIERTPLPLYTLVVLHLYLTLAPFESVVDVTGNKVGEEESVCALAAVFRHDSEEQEVDSFSLMELPGTQDMPPAEGQQPAAMALLCRTTHRRHGDTDTHELVVGVGILYAGDEVEVE